jgi:hypothetical protein
LDEREDPFARVTERDLDVLFPNLFGKSARERERHSQPDGRNAVEIPWDLLLVNDLLGEGLKSKDIWMRRQEELLRRGLVPKIAPHDNLTKWVDGKRVSSLIMNNVKTLPHLHRCLRRPRNKKS